MNRKHIVILPRPFIGLMLTAGEGPGHGRMVADLGLAGLLGAPSTHVTSYGQIPSSFGLFGQPVPKTPMSLWKRAAVRATVCGQR